MSETLRIELLLTEGDSENFSPAVFSAIAKMQIPHLAIPGKDDIVNLDEFPTLHFRVARRDFFFPKDNDSPVKLVISLERQFILR